MPELDVFEARFAAAYRRYLDEVPTAVDAAAIARRLAVAHPHRRAVLGFWPPVAVPRPALVLLLAGLLLAALLGSTLLVGAWRDAPISVVPPTSPSPSMAADQGTNVLATTRAHALPPAATCPPGTDPDAPGPVDQARPAANTNLSTDRAMSFDRRNGRVVLLETIGVHPGPLSTKHTWTFNVCTNTWREMSPPAEPPTGRAWLAYDADSDRTVAVIQSDVWTEPFETWAYDATEDRWTRGSDLPQLPDPNAAFDSAPRAVGLVYHDLSGLIVFHDATNVAAYDVESDSWNVVAQRSDPAMRAGLGRPPAVVLLAYDARRDLFVTNADNGPLDSHVANPATWVFDPATATWSQLTLTETAAIRCGWGFAPECGAVFDPRTGLAVFFAMDGTQIVTYDGGADGEEAWQVLRRSDGAQFDATETCDNDTPVYDSVNERIVCRATWNGVAAIDTGTGTDARPSWLLEPVPRQSPAP